MYQAVCHYGTPQWSNEERAFAADIRATLGVNDIQNSLKNIAGTSGEEGKAFARRHHDTVLIDEVAPRAATENVLAGSTDVGDVSWKAPVAQCFSPCFAIGTPLHSWQLVSREEPPLPIKGCCWRVRYWEQRQFVCSATGRCLKQASRNWLRYWRLAHISARSRVTSYHQF